MVSLIMLKAENILGIITIIDAIIINFLTFFCFSSHMFILVGIFKAFVTISVDIVIKKQFIKNKYPAPKNMSYCLVASPYPAVQRGGISAVAIATPGITLLGLLRVIPIIPAVPPTNAIITSHIVGLVLDNISLPAVVIGVKEK